MPKYLNVFKINILYKLSIDFMSVEKVFIICMKEESIDAQKQYVQPYLNLFVRVIFMFENNIHRLN